MANQYDFLPQSDLILLDTSIVYPNYDRFHSLDIKEKVTKMKELWEQLEDMHNWVAIPEVLKETSLGVRKLRKHMKYGREHGIVIEGLITQDKWRSKLRNLLSSRGAMKELQGLEKQVTELTPQVKKIFIKKGGKTNNLETGIKMIANGLAYASYRAHRGYSHVLIWTYNKPLFLTFASMSNKFKLRNTGLIFDLRRQVLPCYEIQYHKAESCKTS